MFSVAFAGGSAGKIGGYFYRFCVSIWIIFGLIWMASMLSAISDSASHFLVKKDTVVRDTGPEHKERAESNNLVHSL